MGGFPRSVMNTGPSAAAFLALLVSWLNFLLDICDATFHLPCSYVTTSASRKEPDRHGGQIDPPERQRRQARQHRRTKPLSVKWWVVCRFWACSSSRRVGGVGFVMGSGVTDPKRRLIRV